MLVGTIIVLLKQLQDFQDNKNIVLKVKFCPIINPLSNYKNVQGWCSYRNKNIEN